MKTPREILLEKHRSADGQLNSIRSEVLRSEFGNRNATQQPSITGLLKLLWQQLILPSRLTWAGIVTAWIAVFALHFATNDEDGLISAQPRVAKVTPEVRTALQTQQRLFAELINGHPAPARPSVRSLPRPRGDGRPSFRSA